MQISLLLSRLALGLLILCGANAEELALPQVRVTEMTKGPSVQAPEKPWARIVRGKKSVSITREDQGAVTDQSYRQVLSEIPGLNVSEVPNRSFQSINYRGLGDPHESQNIQTLEDGIPISADPYGYPAVYYTPPVPLIEGVEFFQGGAGLLYGPHPSGAIHYKSRPLSLGDDAFHARTQQMLGAFQYFLSANEIEKGFKLGGLDAKARASYVRRQWDGFRPNQDYQVDDVRLLQGLRWDRTEFNLKLSYFNGDYGDPGGLAQTTGTNTLGIDNGFLQSTLLNDRLNIRRTAVELGADTELDQGGKVKNKLFFADYSRYSRRQDRGSAPAYGGVPTVNTATLQDQDFRNFGLDSRLLKKWDDTYRSSFGIFLFHSSSTFNQSASSSATSDAGTLNRSFDRTTFASSLFSELEISLGEFRLVPGVRLERIAQKLDETLNTTGGTGLKNRNETDYVPLFGLGLEKDFYNAGITSYFNLSQGYRPVQFQEGVPLTNTMSVNADLNPAHTYTGELGLKTQDPAAQTRYDVSAFWIRYDNRIGSTATQFINTGAARHFGGEFRVSHGFKFLLPGEIRFTQSAQYLNAQFTEGSLLYKTPQFAPRFTARSRLSHEWSDCFRYSFLFSAVSEQYADDTNTAAQRVPGYGVWDFEVSVKPIRDSQFVILGSIQNLFDRQYWSRVRSNGIDPAPPFSFQIGGQVTF